MEKEKPITKKTMMSLPVGMTCFTYSTVSGYLNARRGADRIAAAARTAEDPAERRVFRISSNQKDMAVYIRREA